MNTSECLKHKDMSFRLGVTGNSTKIDGHLQPYKLKADRHGQPQKVKDIGHGQYHKVKADRPGQHRVLFCL